MAYAKQGSKVVRISPDLHTLLTRRKMPKQTWDDFLRRAFGLQKAFGPKIRKSSSLPLFERWVLPSKTFKSIAEARGEAVQRAVAVGVREVEQPIRMREVP